MTRERKGGELFFFSARGKDTRKEKIKNVSNVNENARGEETEETRKENKCLTACVVMKRRKW